eukprot:m.331352 g.331352  ORF g.331352 m.331352 type:complete len:160 (-) comp16709_c0_seq1:49-528(-)
MQLFVKGIDGRTLTVEASSSTSIAEVKEQVEFKSGIPASSARLVYGGADLADASSIEECEIASYATLHMSLRLLGGGKKKKKKNYTTPKVIKHKHKKVKLAVLKYYRIDENGKITRLRRECPHENCGAGVFMASHFDRQYCGKCGLTYTFSKPEGEAEK